jgi:hypothetical protein
MTEELVDVLQTVEADFIRWRDEADKRLKALWKAHAEYEQWATVYERCAGALDDIQKLREKLV